jgi:RNA polymerase-binding protein DksA
MSTTNIYQKCREQLLLQQALTTVRLANTDRIADTWDVDPHERQSARASRQELREDLRRIDSAIQRFADGRYGTCLSCGQPINAERLERYPLVDSCVDCQRTTERATFRLSRRAAALNQ